MYQILVLDDNTIENERAGAVWAKYHGKLTTVLHVHEVIENLSKIDYHLIVLVEDYLKDELIPTFATLEGLSDLPIIVLTSTPDDKVHDDCMRHGASAYLTIPDCYESGVLRGLSIIKTAHTEIKRRPIKLLGNNGLIICPSFRRVVVHGTQISLTRTEYDILLALIHANGRTLKFSAILRRVWGEEFSDSDPHIVVSHVSNLRKKLKLAADTPEYIMCSRGIGYYWAFSNP